MTKKDTRNLYKLERWCMRRWQYAQAMCNHLAGAEDAQYSRWSKRADNYFAAVERIARLSRLAHHA